MKISLAVPAAVIIAAGGLMVAGCGGSTETANTVDTATGMTEWTDATAAAIDSAGEATTAAGGCPTYSVEAWEGCMSDNGIQIWSVADQIKEAAESALKLDMPVECTAVARQQLKIADEYTVLGDAMTAGMGSVTKITASAKRVTKKLNVGTELSKKCTAAIENGGV